MRARSQRHPDRTYDLESGIVGCKLSRRRAGGVRRRGSSGHIGRWQGRDVAGRPAGPQAGGVPGGNALARRGVHSVARLDGVSGRPPCPGAGGSWVAHGWEASQLVAGDPDVSRQDDVLRTGIAFHTAIADQPRRRSWTSVMIHGPSGTASPGTNSLSRHARRPWTCWSH